MMLFYCRLQVFGLLGGKAVGKAKVGNLGFKDQRLAMEWVQVCLFVGSQCYWLPLSASTRSKITDNRGFAV